MFWFLLPDIAHWWIMLTIKTAWKGWFPKK